MSIPNSSEGTGGYGYYHPPAGDIDEIRELLRGYGSEESLLKELIQNAEDAGATRLVFMLVAGDAKSDHPLLRTPGLCVSNDGPFHPENLEAMSRLRIGTKGKDNRAIGRFGKGLKSVYAVCEAFFVVAATDPKFGWSDSDSIKSRFFNPRSGWRHSDWDSTYSASAKSVIDYVAGLMSGVHPKDTPWVAFWLPLRHPDQQIDSKEKVKVDWIYSTQAPLPGINPELGQSLADVLVGLVPSLAILRNLLEIVIDDRLGSVPLRTSWSLVAGSDRAEAPGDDELKPLKGGMSLHAKPKKNLDFSYSGLVGTLKNSRVAAIKKSGDWPLSIVIDKDDNSTDEETKGEAHFGAIFSGVPAKVGKLRIKWAVFLPVGDQPMGDRESQLKGVGWDITVTLHGFAFLDTQRTKIDWLDECFNPLSPPNRQACLDWNKLVMEAGALPHLPEALATFVQEHRFDMAQIAELTGKLQTLWVWNSFQKAICSRHYWLPRWSAASEAWSLVGAGDAIMAIPKVGDSALLIGCIPGLIAVANKKVLVQERADGLPGLHCGEIMAWPEESVLQLLKGVQLRSDDDDAAANWLNQFLDTLHKKDALTPRILEKLASLPLLPTKDARTEKRRRLSQNEWAELTDSGLIVYSDPKAKYWLPLLAAALPDWVANVADTRFLPEWVGELIPVRCSATWAAEQVLSQSKLEKRCTDRIALAKALAAEDPLNEPTIQAIRFLMHKDASHSRDSLTLLFFSSIGGQEKIWARLIKQILGIQAGDQSWRLLEDHWTGILPGNLCGSLNALGIDAIGVHRELLAGGVDVASLIFASDIWNEKDLSAVMEGLFQAGRDQADETRQLLRRFAIHTLCGARGSRASIAGLTGDLADEFVLDVPGFDHEIPEECRVPWQKFQAETRIIKRLPDSDLANAVQQKLFQKIGEDGELFMAQLDWHFVTRRCLELPNPGDFARILLEALSHGHEAVWGLGKKLSASEWLPLNNGGVIAPATVIWIEGMESELERMLDPKKDRLAAVQQLPNWVRKHQGFATLRQYLPGTKAAAELLAVWLDDKPKWHIGLTESVLPTNLNDLFNILETMEDLPGGCLLAKLRRLTPQGYPEGLEPLLKQTIWKSVLKPFPCEGNRPTRLKQALVQLAADEYRSAFDAYLRQASRDGQAMALLPSIKLVSGKGSWKPADKLAWPSASLNPAAHVCVPHANILDPQRAKGGRREAGAPLKLKPAVELKSAPDFRAEVQKLETYLKPFRDSNIGCNLPAALVAILGGHESMLRLLAELLRVDLRQTPEDFLLRLLGEKSHWLAPEMGQTKFLIEIVQGRAVQVESLTGAPIEVELTNSIDSLLVGDQEELSRPHRVPNSSVVCRRLRLRPIADPNQLDDPVAVFSRTVEMIMIGAYQFCPNGLTETMAEISDGGQADLRRSQSYLLDMAEARLKELGARESPALGKILKSYDQARLDRVDAQDFSQRSPQRATELSQRAQQTEKEARIQLQQILTSKDSDDVRQMLVNAVRRKMTDFEYSIDSTVMELFQNADDAVAELRDMRGTLERGHKKFVVRLNPEPGGLEIIHWGRPINQHSYGPYMQGRLRGFDQDLHKMLTLNFSEKGSGAENAPASVTGRFGLGFKSVFFVSEEPKVVSGRLGFQIRGGFYPVSLPSEIAKQLRDSAAQVNEPGLVATIIRLEWKGPDMLDKIRPVVAWFRSVAPLLTIFSRCLETVVVADEREETPFIRDESELFPGKVFRRILVGDAVYLAICCHIPQDEKPATILLHLDTHGVTKLPAGLPNLWITTPTIEQSDLAWAINAPFKPDAGRQRLALKNPENTTIAGDVAKQFGAALIEMFDAMKKDWSGFAQRLKLHPSCTHEGWWATFWTEMTASAPVCEWAKLQEGGQILSWIAWNDPAGAVRHLIRHRTAIPSQLPGPYKGLVSSEKVRFRVDGILSADENGIFEQLSQWDSMQTKCPPGTTVKGTVGAFLEKASCVDQLDRLTLEKALSSEVGPDNQPTPHVAHKIGSLLKECPLAFDESDRHAPEIKRLKEWMQQMKLLSMSGAYQPANSLVCDRKVLDLIENDEVLRAQFAPPRAVLSREYSDEGIAFFVQARERLTAGAAILSEWVAEATVEKLSKIFHYLIHGDLGEELAGKLELSWLEEKRGTEAYKGLSLADRNELVRKFSKGQDLSLMAEMVQPSLPVGPKKPVHVMPSETAFRLVAEWWRKERARWERTYEEKSYPPGFPGALPWPGDDAWDSVEQPSAKSGWLVLFINAALLPLGFNQIGRDLSFIRYLVDRRWIRVLENVTQDPGALLAALDSYLDEGMQTTKFHFPMRQLITFYASAKNLESYVEAICQAEKSQRQGTFGLVFSPRANPELTGTGIDAPPIGGMLGKGSSQLLRELYRLKRLKNPAGHPFAFTPIRKVRRLCALLFETSDSGGSEEIYQTLSDLGEECKLDPTFGHCFDLPFQFLAQDSKLRERVLKQDFDMDLAEDSDSDAAPQNFPEFVTP